ncbi:MAG: hypothetical protein PF693_02260 [Spirochaetia bacterium]|nr:hypothetical protein [Spirochaetia bacterium]
MKKTIIKMLINPIFGSIVAGLAVFAGFIVSIFSNEIRNSFPIFLSKNLDDYGALSRSSLLFWVIFIVFLVLTAFRQFFKDKEMILQRKNLLDTLQTLPPHEFAIKYRDEYNRIEKNVNRLNILISTYNNETDEPTNVDDMIQFEESIRIILDAYVSLVQIWDTPESIMADNSIYRANLMIYYDINELPSAIEANLFKMTNFFVEKNIQALKSSIDGILLLEDEKFTTTTESKEPLPDKTIKPICLPITLDENNGKRKQNLPGAPHSFVTGRPQWIINTLEIPEICERNVNFDGDTLIKIKNYYEADTKARSIISLPLRILIAGNEKVIGVVNIYCNKNMILRNEVRAGEFASFLEPFNSVLCNALTLYVEAWKVIGDKNVD